MAVSVDEVEVLAQNRAFYAAFRQRDLDSMDELWAQRVTVACVHPGWQPIRGREQVMASWRAILGQSSVPQVRCADASAHVMGETAFVLCEELLGEGRLVATNIFVREDDDWRLVHHQAGPMAHGAQDEASDEFQITLGGSHGIAGGEVLGGLRLEQLTELSDEEAEADAAAADADAAELGDEDEDPFELIEEDSLAGGNGASLSRGRGALDDAELRRHSELADLSDLSDLDDNEAPERFLNLIAPATRRLLN